MDPCRVGGKRAGRKHQVRRHVLFVPTPTSSCIGSGTSRKNPSDSVPEVPTDLAAMIEDDG